MKNRGNDPTSNPSRHETKGHLHWYLFQELTTPVTISEPLVASSGKAREGSERKRQRSELEVRDHHEAKRLACHVKGVMREKDVERKEREREKVA